MSDEIKEILEAIDQKDISRKCPECECECEWTANTIQPFGTGLISLTCDMCGSVRLFDKAVLLR